MKICDLTWIKGFWYLGSPYSKYPQGPEAAFVDVSKIAAELLRCGVAIFAPIAHSHPIAEHGGIDPLSHEIWLPADRPMMDAAAGLIVAKMESWRESYGLTHEIEVFTKAGKPVIYLDVQKFTLSERPDADDKKRIA
jgi:hypothetical protein